MARVTIERTLDKCESRFELSVLTSYRAHAIECGSQAVVNAHNKFAVLALREIESGKIDIDQLRNTVIEKYALENQTNVAKNSFIINDYSIKEDNTVKKIEDSFDQKSESKNSKLNISSDYFAS